MKMALTLLACETKDGANEEGASWLRKPERKAVKRAVLGTIRSR